ncbi:hypothetical protein KAW38_02350 [Candidatus Micrarchaeota archaeon]|nr:hypothetical protein [Candidatus Micrarchaeota archaeon]
MLTLESRHGSVVKILKKYGVKKQPKKRSGKENTVGIESSGNRVIFK